MNSPAIEVADLSRDFGGVPALSGVGLRVESGNVLALLGPNGAGKTTLLRLLMGLLEPSEGEVRVLGADSRQMPASLESHRVGVGEGLVPPNWVTLKDIVDLQAGGSPRFRRETIERLCRESGLSLRSTFGSLSKGQRAWFLSGLILSSGAKVLLMDEPAEGVDTANRRKLYDLLRDHVNEHDATAVVATHIINDIERVADEVAFMKRGRLILQASLEDLREEVRELECSSAAEQSVHRNGIQLLGRRCEGGTVRLWVRFTHGDTELLDRDFGEEVSIRTVGLESLYLAVTEDAEEFVA